MAYFLLIYVTNVLVYLVLFIVYINDIKSGVNVNICLFADDTSLYIVVDHPNTACTVLSSDLQTVYSWSQILLAPYSTAISRQSTPGPRHGLYPSTQSSPSPCYFRENLISRADKLHMNNIAIEHVESHIGITLSSDATWSNHISLMLGKA